MNAPAISYMPSLVPFANLMLGSGRADGRWAPLSAEHQDKDGNVRSKSA